MISLSSHFLSIDAAACQIESNQISKSRNPENDLRVSRAVLDNSSLRRYFRDDYLVKNYYRRKITFKSAEMPNVPWALLEQWIDEQIISHSEEIAEKLNNLKQNYDTASVLIEGLTKEAGNGNLRSESRLFFKSFRNETKSLRQKIDFMISGFPSRPKGENLMKSMEIKTVPERMRLVKMELDEAEKLIMNYFFTSAQTVTVEDIKNNNMMIHLYRMEKILETIEKSI